MVRDAKLGDKPNKVIFHKVEGLQDSDLPRLYSYFRMSSDLTRGYDTVESLRSVPERLTLKIPDGKSWPHFSHKDPEYTWEESFEPNNSGWQKFKNMIFKIQKKLAVRQQRPAEFHDEVSSILVLNCYLIWV
jgi:hypothetical protein